MLTAVCSHLVGIAPCTVLVLGRVEKEESGDDNQVFGTQSPYLVELYALH